MTTRKGNNPGKAGSPGTGGHESPKAAASSSSASDQAIQSLLTLQNDCLQELNRISERVERESNKLAAERMNKLHEIQLSTYKVQHDAYFKFNIDALGGKATPDAEQSLRTEVVNRQKQEKEAIEEANQQANAALQDLNESANQDWENTCRGFLESIKDELGKMDESTASPDLLMAMGQSLIWISSCMRKPVSEPQAQLQ